MKPTEEQAQALDLFGTGEPLVIEAGAGTGKTTTLKLLAASTKRRGAYTAFNKAIVRDTQSSMPGNVTASTVHSLAFRAVGSKFSHRLNQPRMKSMDLARRLDVDPMVVTVGNAGTKRLSPGYLASHVMRAVTRFCQTADREPNPSHFPYIDGIDMPDAAGHRTFTNNDRLAQALLPAAFRAWIDLSDPAGSLPYKHEHYLKTWQLSGPEIPADFILFDEAQDANPVMLAIVAAQEHAQLVYVGDSQQQIYEFTGAINALGSLADANRTYLTQSFRFGPTIASSANIVLETLGADLRLRGTPEIPSTVGRIDQPDAILCRTNAAAVSLVLTYLSAGRACALVGGADEVVRFAKAAISLRNDGWTGHAELACFKSWAEVQEYVANDAQGDDLKLMVGLIDEFSPEVIIGGLGQTAAEDVAEVVVSTAHKAKGREWDRVRLGGDFPDAETADPSELRLLYVGVTRARLELDATACTLFSPVDRPVIAERVA